MELKNNNFLAYDPESLIIFAWTAVIDEKGEFTISWINDSLIGYLSHYEEFHEEAFVKDDLRLELADFLFRLVELKADESRSEELWNNIGFGRKYKDFLQELWQAYSEEEDREERILQCCKKIERCEDEFAGIRLAPINLELKKVESSSTEGNRKIIGLRSVSEYGLPLKEVPDYDRYYDLFSVFQIDESSQKIKGLQGLLIPVGERKKISDDKYEEALKSAKAAIMGRNMSHNIGSHVIFYLKDYLKSIPSILENQVLQDLVTYTYKSEGDKAKLNLHENAIAGHKKGEVSASSLKEQMNVLELPFLKGMGRFFTYLQERQDFIATIATDHIPFFTTINFKEFVYDEFVHDDKLHRHNKGKENIKQETNILLSFIAKSENLDRKDIEIRIDDYNPKDEIPANAKFRNYEVDLPGGLVGRQAIFSILENIIRNAAKHSHKQSDGLTLSINFVDDEVHRDLYRLEIIDNKPLTKETLRNIKENLEDDFLDPVTLQLKETNKGLKEMRISSAWLRGIRVSNEKTTSPKPIEVSMSKSGCLQYTIYLLKPRKIAVLSDRLRLNDEQMSMLNAAGWSLFAREHYENENFNYRMTVCFEEEIGEPAVLRSLKLRSNRLLVLPNSDLITFIEETSQTKDFAKGLEFIHSKDIELQLEYLKKELLPGNAHPLVAIQDDAQGDEQIGEAIKNKELKGYFQNGLVKNPYVNIDSSLLFNEDGEYNNAKLIAFRKHLSSQEDWDKFIDSFDEDECMEHVLHVESITGNNSTSRIARNDIKDDQWLLKLIECGLLRVLIFDERLWDMFGTDSARTVNKEPTQLMYKGVEVCTWDIEENNQSHIYNIFNEKMGRLTYERGKLKIKSNQFDYAPHIVSIHQGLLDKIEERLMPKDERDKSERFKSILNSIEEQLSPKLKFIVHSGRSRPPFLPKDVPFLPFSGLEVALLDAKLTLTEQLLSAKVN